MNTNMGLHEFFEWPDQVGPRLFASLSSSEARNIAVIGDAMRDVWVYARLLKAGMGKHGETVHKFTETVMCDGGAANVANNLSTLGCGVKLYYGRDASGRIPEKTRVVVDGEQVMRFDEYDSVEPAQLDKFPVNGWDAVVVSDYCKGSVDRAVCRLLALVNERTPVFIHTKGDPSVWPRSLQKRAFWLCNRAEWEAQQDYYSTLPNVIITDGSRGSVWREWGALRHHTNPILTQVVSTCGAGDSYLAGFVVEMLSSKDVLPAMRYASAVASVAISKPATATAYKDEVKRRAPKLRILPGSPSKHDVSCPRSYDCTCGVRA